MIEFLNYSFRYASASNPALENIELKIFPGEFVLLIGDSGSGKTTFLRSINGLIPHFYGGSQRGEVRIDGKSVKNFPPREIANYVGTVFQDPENQILMHTVEKEIAFPLENIGMKEEEIEKRVEETLDVLDIYPLRHRKIESLSGGEKQKVAIATAIARYPRYLLLDEPTSQIDPNSAESLLSLLERLNDDLGIGIIMVEHRMERTMHRADRLIVLDRGKIVGDGEPRIIASKLDLDALGVGYPQITRVAKRFGVEMLPLTVKEGRKSLSRYLKNVRVKEERILLNDLIGEVLNIEFSYGAHRVIRKLNLKIYRNELLGLVGRNGTGKTTLAKLLTGLLRPQKGEIRILGKPIEKYGEKERSRAISMVFQNPNIHLLGDTIYEDVTYLLSDKERKRAENIMKELGIWELRDRNASELSGGERMLAAVASIAVMEPEILILDEPTRGLSYKFKLRLSSFLKKYIQRHSVILITHDVETLARNATRVAILSDGRIRVIGNKREIMCSSLTYSTQVNKVAQGIEGVDKKILVEEDLEVIK